LGQLVGPIDHGKIMFFKKEEEKYEGVVERIGIVQESTNDAARTRCALLLKGESEPRLVDTKFGNSPDAIELRVRIALTAPGDYITVHREGRYVVEFQNRSLAALLNDGVSAASTGSS